MPRPSTRDRWDLGLALLCSALHQTSRNTWTNRGGIGPSLHPRDLAPTPKDPAAGEGALPCLALPWYDTRVSAITPLALWVPVLVPLLNSYSLLVLVRALGSMQSNKGLDGFLVPARLASPNCLASQLKVLATIYSTGFQRLVQRSLLHHRIVFVVL